MQSYYERPLTQIVIEKQKLEEKSMAYLEEISRKEQIKAFFKNIPPYNARNFTVLIEDAQGFEKYKKSVYTGKKTAKNPEFLDERGRRKPDYFRVWNPEHPLSKYFSAIYFKGPQAYVSVYESLIHFGLRVVHHLEEPQNVYQRWRAGGGKWKSETRDALLQDLLNDLFGGPAEALTYDQVQEIYSNYKISKKREEELTRKLREAELKITELQSQKEHLQEKLRNVVGVVNSSSNSITDADADADGVVDVKEDNHNVVVNSPSSSSILQSQNQLEEEEEEEEVISEYLRASIEIEEEVSDEEENLPNGDDDPTSVFEEKEEEADKDDEDNKSLHTMGEDHQADYNFDDDEQKSLHALNAPNHNDDKYFLENEEKESYDKRNLHTTMEEEKCPFDDAEIKIHGSVAEEIDHDHHNDDDGGDDHKILQEESNQSNVQNEPNLHVLASKGMEERNHHHDYISGKVTNKKTPVHGDIKTQTSVENKKSTSTSKKKKTLDPSGGSDNKKKALDTSVGAKKESSSPPPNCKNTGGNAEKTLSSKKKKALDTSGGTGEKKESSPASSKKKTTVETSDVEKKAQTSDGRGEKKKASPLPSSEKKKPPLQTSGEDKIKKVLDPPLGGRGEKKQTSGTNKQVLDTPLGGSVEKKQISNDGGKTKKVVDTPLGGSGEKKQISIGGEGVKNKQVLDTPSGNGEKKQTGGKKKKSEDENSHHHQIGKAQEKKELLGRRPLQDSNSQPGEKALKKLKIA